MLTRAKGSNDPAWWTNSTSDVLESKLPVVVVVPLPVSVSELTESSNLTIASFRPSVVLMVALVGPALRLPVPPQPVAKIMATIATVRSKYRFIGASKFSASGEVLAVDKCTWRAKLAKRRKCCFFSRRRFSAGKRWGAAHHHCGDKPHRIKHLGPMAKSNVRSDLTPRIADVEQVK